METKNGLPYFFFNRFLVITASTISLLQENAKTMLAFIKRPQNKHFLLNIFISLKKKKTVKTKNCQNKEL